MLFPHLGQPPYGSKGIAALGHPKNGSQTGDMAIRVETCAALRPKWSNKSFLFVKANRANRCGQHIGHISDLVKGFPFGHYRATNCA